MDLSDVPGFLATELSYPVALDTVIKQIGNTRINGPNTDDTETIATILSPLRTDTFESPETLYETIYGNMSDDHIGRKYYDDRGGTQLDAYSGPTDDENVSF
jgi:hypothetical protein